MEARPTGSFTSPYFTPTPPAALPQGGGNNTNSAPTALPQSNGTQQPPRQPPQQFFQQRVQGGPPQNSSAAIPRAPMNAQQQTPQRIPQQMVQGGPPQNSSAAIPRAPMNAQQQTPQRIPQQMVQGGPPQNSSAATPRAPMNAQQLQKLQYLQLLQQHVMQSIAQNQNGALDQNSVQNTQQNRQTPPTVPQTMATRPGTMAAGPGVFPQSVSNSLQTMPPRGLMFPSTSPSCNHYQLPAPPVTQNHTITLEDRGSGYLELVDEEPEYLDMEDEEPEYVDEETETPKLRKRFREEKTERGDKTKQEQDIYQNIHRIGLQAFKDNNSNLKDILEILEEGKTKIGGISKSSTRKLREYIAIQQRKMMNIRFPELPPVSTITTSSQPPVKKRKVEIVKKPKSSEYLKHPKLCADLGQLINREEGSDVIFVVDNEKFYAHRSILFARSKWFESLFLRGFSEGISQNVGEKQEIEFQECNKEEFKVLLGYLYTGNLIINNQSLLKLYALANRLLLDEMETLCIKHLEKMLTVHSTLPLLKESYDMHLDETSCGEAIFRHVLRYSEDLLGSFIFDESNLFPESLMVKLIASDHLILESDFSENEYAIYSFVQQWVHLSKAEEEVKETIKSLIRLDLLNESKLRNLKRQPDCLFDSHTLDRLIKKEGKVDFLSEYRTSHPLSIIDGKGTKIVSKTDNETVFYLSIPFNQPLKDGHFLIMTWNDMNIFFHGEPTGILLQNPILSLSVQASPEKLTGGELLVDASVEMLSPTVTQDSLISSPQILQMSRERFNCRISLRELFQDKEKVKKLITGNHFNLKIRLKKVV